MKIMKTMFMLLLSAALVFSFAGVGFGQELNGGGDLPLDQVSSGSTLVEYHNDKFLGNYTVTIPDSIYLDGLNEEVQSGELLVELGQNFPTAEKGVTVSVQSSNELNHGNTYGDSWFVANFRVSEGYETDEICDTITYKLIFAKAANGERGDDVATVMSNDQGSNFLFITDDEYSINHMDVFGVRTSDPTENMQSDYPHYTDILSFTFTVDDIPTPEEGSDNEGTE